MTRDLSAIRARDAAWQPYCGVCEDSAGSVEHEPVEAGCRWPAEHHAYEPSADSGPEGAERDRRALLAMLDRPSERDAELLRTVAGTEP